MSNCARQPDRVTRPDGSVSPTELLVKEVAAGALDSAADDGNYQRRLGALGPLSESTTQLRAVRLLGRGVLTADIASVKAVEEAIAGRTHRERRRIISTLGKLSSAAGQSTGAALEPVLSSAARECALASSLIETTREIIAGRQTNHRFIHWVTAEPDGFSRWVWSVALRTAGGRIWDRSWIQIADELEDGSWVRLSLLGPDDERAGWRSFDESAAIARDAAVDALVDAALRDNPTHPTEAWRNAMAGAEHACGSLTWAHFANTVRAEIGPTRWTTTIKVITDQVAVVVNDLPWIAGYVGMIALAAEAAIAPVRAAVVIAGARAMTRFSNIEDALSAAVSETRGRLAMSA